MEPLFRSTWPGRAGKTVERQIVICRHRYPRVYGHTQDVLADRNTGGQENQPPACDCQALRTERLRIKNIEVRCRVQVERECVSDPEARNDFHCGSHNRGGFRYDWILAVRATLAL